MKKKNKIVPFIIALMLIICLAMDMEITSLAAEAGSVDLDQIGTITVSLKEADWSKAKNNVLTVYKVAELRTDDENLEYSYTDDFAGYEETLELDDYTLAGNLAEYASNSGIEGTLASVNNDGNVIIEDLELGLYLIVQTSTSAKYYTFNPFLVSIPYKKDGQWVYEVDAGPKVELVTPDEPDNPENPDKTKKTNNPKKSDNTKKTGTSKKSDSSLPQTGQLNWPIPVLAISGFILLLLGQLITKKQKKCIENEV